MFGFRRPSFLPSRPRRSLSAAKPAAIVENVEPRVMLDGNITASLVNGHLKLVGDTANNDLVVTIASNGTVTLSSNSTTVNGVAADVADDTLSGVVNSIASAMNEGDDSLQILGPLTVSNSEITVPTISGDVTVRLGDGADSFTLRGVRIGGRVYAAGEGQNDVLTIEAVGVTDDFIAAGNRNDDQLSIRQVIGVGNIFARGGGETDQFTIGEEVVPGQNSVLALDSATRRESETENRFIAPPENLSSESSADRTTRLNRSTEINNIFAANPHQAADAQVYSAWNSTFASTDPTSFAFTPSTAFPTEFPAYDASQFTRHPSGILYRVIEQGANERPTIASTVEVNYQGVLASDGTQFDSSYDRNQSAEFALRGLIRGWQEGLQIIGEGGQIQLLIPPSLAYGEQGSGANIPPNATIFFNVELVDIIS